MIKQIGNLKQSDSDLTVRLPSLLPVNPDNAADPWEKEWLLQFKKGVPSAAKFVARNDGSHVFRYIEPVFVKSICLEYHLYQGYKEGDVRAGISIISPVSELYHTMRIEHIHDTGGIFIGWALGIWIMVIVHRGKTSDKEHIEETSAISISDELTGLTNRGGFLTLAQQPMALAERMKHKMILCFFDLNDFKEINDTFGHSEGDKVLIRTANNLRNTFRQSDIISRFGGDEFVVLAVNCDETFSKLLRERLEETIEKDNQNSDALYQISMSIGFAEFDPESPRILEELILEADHKMYEDKLARKERLGKV